MLKQYIKIIGFKLDVKEVFSKTENLKIARRIRNESKSSQSLKGQWSGWGGWTATEIDWLINLLWTPSTSSTVESYSTFIEWCFWPATIFLLYIKATVLSVLLLKIT